MYVRQPRIVVCECDVTKRKLIPAPAVTATFGALRSIYKSGQNFELVLNRFDYGIRFCQEIKTSDCYKNPCNYISLLEWLQLAVAKLSRN